MKINQHTEKKYGFHFLGLVKVVLLMLKVFVTAYLYKIFGHGVKI